MMNQHDNPHQYGERESNGQVRRAGACDRLAAAPTHVWQPAVPQWRQTTTEASEQAPAAGCHVANQAAAHCYPQPNEHQTPFQSDRSESLMQQVGLALQAAVQAYQPVLRKHPRTVQPDRQPIRPHYAEWFAVLPKHELYFLYQAAKDLESFVIVRIVVVKQTCTISNLLKDSFFRRQEIVPWSILKHTSGCDSLTNKRYSVGILAPDENIGHFS
jgi:hypothetical protein